MEKIILTTDTVSMMSTISETSIDNNFVNIVHSTTSELNDLINEVHNQIKKQKKYNWTHAKKMR